MRTALLHGAFIELRYVTLKLLTNRQGHVTPYHFY